MPDQRVGAFLLARHAGSRQRRGIQSRAGVHLLPALEEGRGDGLLRDGQQASAGRHGGLVGYLGVLVSSITSRLGGGSESRTDHAVSPPSYLPRVSLVELNSAPNRLLRLSEECTRQVFCPFVRVESVNVHEVR